MSLREKDAHYRSHSHTIQQNDLSIQALKDEQKQALLSHAEEMTKLNTEKQIAIDER